MKSMLLFIFVSTGCKLQAQYYQKNIPGRSDRFHSFNTAQLLNGSTITSFAIHTVNGFQLGNFFGGIGTGFDNYYHVSIPLFAEGRIDLIKRKGKIQFFGNGGLNFPFSSQNKKFELLPGHYKMGSTYGCGLDYLVLEKNNALILGVAFSNKHIIQLIDNNIWNPALNRSENSPIKNEYSLNRIAIRVGWMF